MTDITDATTEELISEIVRRRDAYPGAWQDVDEAFSATGYALIEIEIEIDTDAETEGVER